MMRFVYAVYQFCKVFSLELTTLKEYVVEVDVEKMGEILFKTYRSISAIIEI